MDDALGMGGGDAANEAEQGFEECPARRDALQGQQRRPDDDGRSLAIQFNPMDRLDARAMTTALLELDPPPETPTSTGIADQSARETMDNDADVLMVETDGAGAVFTDATGDEPEPFASPDHASAPSRDGAGIRDVAVIGGGSNHGLHGPGEGRGVALPVTHRRG